MKKYLVVTHTGLVSCPVDEIELLDTSPLDVIEWIDSHNRGTFTVRLEEDDEETMTYYVDRAGCRNTGKPGPLKDTYGVYYRDKEGYSSLAVGTFKTKKKARKARDLLMEVNRRLSELK